MNIKVINQAHTVKPKRFKNETKLILFQIQWYQSKEKINLNSLRRSNRWTFTKEAWCKWGLFGRTKLIFKILPDSWTKNMLTISFKSFPRSTLHFCSAKDCEVASFQIRIFEKNMPLGPKHAGQWLPGFNTWTTGVSSKCNRP